MAGKSFNDNTIYGDILGVISILILVYAYLSTGGDASRPSVQTPRVQPTSTARPPTPTPTAPIAYLSIDPSSLTLTAGHSTTFTAVAYDEFENRIPIFLNGGPQFSTSNGSGSINSRTGIFTASVNPGFYENGVWVTILTRSGSMAAQADITILAP
ncbi:MAG: hypothetical protein V3T49_04365 [Dehalococcoidia bacterium]